MATFTDIYNNIQAVANRPDIQTFIESRINSAISLISSSGYYKDDLKEVTLDAGDGISPTSFVQSIALPTNFRSVLYIDYPDPTNKKPINALTVSDIGHRAARYESNIYYVSGALLHIKHEVLTPSFVMGYFDYPATLSGANSNWITARYPWLVEEIVLTQLKVITGDNEGAALVDRLNKSQMQIWLKDALQNEHVNVNSGRQ
jgi:hypothetical protein